MEPTGGGVDPDATYAAAAITGERDGRSLRGHAVAIGGAQAAGSTVAADSAIAAVAAVRGRRVQSTVLARAGNETATTCTGSPVRDHAAGYLDHWSLQQDAATGTTTGHRTSVARNHTRDRD